MSNQLQENLDAILLDKNTNLKPENLKAGVTCLGVEGTAQTGIDTSDATATADDIIKNKTAYVNGVKLTGTIEATTAVGISASEVENIGNDALGNGRINVSTTSASSYLKPNGEINVSVLHKDIANAIGLTGDKIKAGEKVLDVNGTLEPGIDTSDANATASDIVKNKTAYANNEKITGVISEVKADSSIGGSYDGPRYDNLTNTIYIEYNEDLDIYYFKYDIKNDTVLRQGAKVNYQMRRSGLRDYFEVSTEKIKSGEQIMGVTGSFDIEYMPNGFGDNDTTYYVEGDSSYVKDQEILVPYYDTDGGINKNFAIVGNYAILNYRQMNEMTVEDTGYILTEVLSDMETGTDTMLAVKLKIKEILLPEHISNTGTDFK